MPELPTREELAEIIHPILCDGPPGYECLHWHEQSHRDLYADAADAVLHRLMRDADTEYAHIWTGPLGGEYVDLYGDDVYAAEQAHAISKSQRSSVVSRRSVTFTGEWEPAGKAE